MDQEYRSEHDQAETKRRLEGYLAAYPGLRGRVCRILLLHLHSEGRVRIEDVYRRAQRSGEWNAPSDPNVPSSRLWAADEKELINEIVIDLAAANIAPERVDEIVWAAHRRDEAQSLETLARMPGIPLELVAEKVSQYASLPRGPTEERDTPVGTKVALIRRIISDRVDYISIAKRHLRIRDLDWVLQRCVSTDHGQGLVGGKAAGMLLAGAILNGCDPCGPVELPETVFVLTDAYDEFKQVNGLAHLEDHKYKSIEEVRADFRAIGEVFHNAEFPPRVSDLLRLELDRRGELPLIVRSSSLLEDSFGATFSGIYRSI
ncbi:MAG: PEP/pyruvate-binding domain-containing protein, partial [Planctomycetota bacterium]|nr:PEP/pyruvate-binding domain-containing protein [Planctomycetota bacterium]